MSEPKKTAAESIADQAVKWVKIQMAAQGVSQKELAFRIGVSACHVSRFLHGRQPPSLKQISRLAEALGAVVELHFLEAGGSITGKSKTVEEVAVLVGCKPEFIRMLISVGRIHAQRSFIGWMIPEGEIPQILVELPANRAKIAALK